MGKSTISMAIFSSYVTDINRLPIKNSDFPQKSPFSYGFPMLFPWFSHGFPMGSPWLHLSDACPPVTGRSDGHTCGRNHRGAAWWLGLGAEVLGFPKKWRFCHWTWPIFSGYTGIYWWFSHKKWWCSSQKEGWIAGNWGYLGISGDGNFMGIPSLCSKHLPVLPCPLWLFVT